MKRLPIIILLALICLSACTQNKKTIIEGTVLEYGTDKPIEGAKVPILIGFLTGPIQGGYETIGTAITDASGHFKWESDEDIQNDWYAIGRIKANQYFSLNWNASGDYHTSIEYGDHYNNTMHLDPHAYLHLHVEDVPEVEGSYVRFGGWMIPGTKAIELYENEEYNNIFLAVGNRTDDNKFYYRFTNNPNDLIRDTLIIPAHDTLYYHLKY